MSMRRQREYGMSSAGMHLRPVDSSLHTMGPFSEPLLRLTKIISTVKVQSLFHMRQDGNGSQGYFAIG